MRAPILEFTAADAFYTAKWHMRVLFLLFIEHRVCIRRFHRQRAMAGVFIGYISVCEDSVCATLARAAIHVDIPFCQVSAPFGSIALNVPQLVTHSHPITNAKREYECAGTNLNGQANHADRAQAAQTLRRAGAVAQGVEEGLAGVGELEKKLREREAQVEAAATQQREARAAAGQYCFGLEK